MAIVDLTLARSVANFSDPNFVNFGSSLSGTPTLWSWLSVAGHRIDVTGVGFTYAAGQLTAGTVSAIGFDLNNNGPAANEIAITGLSVAAVTLDDGADSFWRILDGGDVIITPLLANQSTGSKSVVFADGLNARNGATGGNDAFDLGDTYILALGDVYNVGSQIAASPAVTYTGGNDTLEGRDTIEFTSATGDVQNVNASGKLIGGDDSITLRSSTLSEAVGDAFSVDGIVDNIAELVGGDDRLYAMQSAPGTASLGAFLIGDVDEQGSFASVTGGSDKLYGSAWNDFLTGDVRNNFSAVIGGADVIYGYEGNDKIFGDMNNAKGDIVGGNDTLYGGNGADQLFGEFGNSILGLSIVGGDDKMYGEAGQDELRGQSGNDILDGGSDIDVMAGGTGNDQYYVDMLGDAVTELAGEGTTDHVFVSTSYFLDGNQEIELLSTTDNLGSSAINLNGNNIGNTITGNNGANIINGSLGADTMIGLNGIDLYYVDNALDTVFEAAGGGTADRVLTTVNYTLGVNQQIELFSTTNSTGAVAINLTGNNFANTMLGNTGANIINGGGGIDRMTGLNGNDHYYVDNFSDVVVETAGGGTGDRVITSVNYVLGLDQQIELFSTNDTTSAAAINLVGNNLANRILGSNGANVIGGGLGNDFLTGGGSSDKFRFSDAIASGANIDTISDFAHGIDDMQLFTGIFINIGGTLDVNELRLGTSATTAAQRIIYDGTTGNLFFDADGNGATAQVQFAKVTASTALDINDFIMI